MKRFKAWKYLNDKSGWSGKWSWRRISIESDPFHKSCQLICFHGIQMSHFFMRSVIKSLFVLKSSWFIKINLLKRGRKAKKNELSVVVSCSHDFKEDEKLKSFFLNMNQIFKAFKSKNNQKWHFNLNCDCKKELQEMRGTFEMSLKKLKSTWKKYLSQFYIEMTFINSHACCLNASYIQGE